MAINGITVPALRGKQGDRLMYLVLPSNRALTNFFAKPPEMLPDQRSQRALDPRHAADIAHYIEDNSGEYILGALTYASDVEGEFQESTVDAHIGLLTLPLDARLRSIDGQHRLAGVQQALETLEALAADNTAALIYVEPDLQARRQMFSDMNATPKIVAKSLNVAFDSRDPFAKTTTLLVNEHPLLKGRVELEAARVKAGTDKIFSLGAVYDALKRLVVGPNGRVRNPQGHDEAEINRRGRQFFDLLGARREYAEATSAERVDNLRTQSLLFSSTMLRVLAGAFYRAGIEQKRSLSEIGEALRQIDFRPGAKLWLETGLVSLGKTTPNARNQEVFAATTAVAKILGWRIP